MASFGRLLEILLPPTVDRRLPGAQFPLYLFVPIAVLSTARSLVHIFAPDGGAGTIAGLDLSVPGADGIVFSFALWGSAQLVYAILQLLVAFRYRSLVPLMWLILIVETLLRQLVGHLKPVHFAHTPPGAIGNYINLPLAAAMLALCLWSASRAPKLGSDSEFQGRPTGVTR